jgi:uncharacterized alpha-E superfamily protein
MYRFTGWRFLEIGRRIERGIHMARISATLAAPDAPGGALEMLLEIGDSVLTHRRQFSVNVGRYSVLDLLALDPLNPRSILFQLDSLKEEISRLPGGEAGHLSPAGKEVLNIHTRLSIVDPRAIDTKDLDAVAIGLGTLSDVVSRSYFT